MNKVLLKNLMEENKKENRIALCEELFSKRLKELRRDKNFTQKEVAKKLNIAISTYANWEQGRTRPGIYDIFILLWVFDIDANALFAIKGITEE